MRGDKIYLYFVGLGDSDFRIEIAGDFSNQEQVYECNKFLEILQPLPELVWIDGIRKVTDELKARIDSAIKNTSMPELNKLKAKVNKYSNGWYFFVLQRYELSVEDEIKYRKILSCVNKDNESAYILEKGHKEFRSLIDSYDIISPRMDKGSPVLGENKKCRFCNKTKEQGASFKKIAHVIPASLGNKYLKTLEECDECNEYFGNNIEPHLINYLALFRNIWNVQSRNSSSLEMSSKNSRLYSKRDKNGKSITIIESKYISDDGKTLRSNVCIPDLILQNIYKAFVKMVINVLPEKELVFLQDTINWVRTSTMKDNLPPIMDSMIYSSSNFNVYTGKTSNESIGVSGLLNVYIRKIDDYDLPHVLGEFVLGTAYYVFALPLSQKDSITDDFFYTEKFKEIFKFYQPHNWNKRTYNISEKSDLKINILVQRKQGENN
ncbi:HNH endonuclease [Actinobacillus equuli]|uniref:HNH endonuclease n=1 Tax=Actinobacillus equuli TaxID=718 RepID=UPI002441F758|nr:HNH endonuclease [Actinobacillus equuli]WGE85301.1 HNH endonuclease [Actinobacillus equuli subsp. haemolyticus]